MTSRRGSDRVAEALRDAPPLNEVAQARMEKALIEQVRAGAPGRTPVSAAPRRRGRGLVMAAGAGALAAAAAALFVLLPDGEPGSGDPASASFSIYEDGETIRRGVLGEGEMVDTRARQRVEVRFDDVRVDVTPDSRARFERIAGELLSVRLERGAVEVEFHPERRGEVTLSVETSSATVQVVGTVFRVEVDGAGATRVSVQEGTVRVVPRADGEPRLVRAGEETAVGSAAVTTAALEVESTAPGGEADPRQVSVETRAAEESATAVVAEASAAAAGGEEEPMVEPPGDPESGGDAEEAARQPTLEQRFERARTLDRQGRRVEARRLLAEIARTAPRRADRARAHTLIAESFSAEGDHRSAAEAYGRAVALGGRSLHGLNALFALAGLEERHLRDPARARASYGRYLSLAPEGPHADLCRQHLCRLGERGMCP